MSNNNLKEFPVVGTQHRGPIIYGFSAMIAVVCGCGAGSPMIMPYIPGLFGIATCPKCRSKIELASFTWKKGDSFPTVELAVDHPNILIPKGNVPKI